MKINKREWSLIPSQEFSRVLEAEGRVVIFNIVGREKFVELAELRVVSFMKDNQARNTYLCIVGDVDGRPFEILW